MGYTARPSLRRALAVYFFLGRCFVILVPDVLTIYKPTRGGWERCGWPLSCHFGGVRRCHGAKKAEAFFDDDEITWDSVRYPARTTVVPTQRAHHCFLVRGKVYKKKDACAARWMEKQSILGEHGRRACPGRVGRGH
jgi:hypothetical protein